MATGNRKISADKRRTIAGLGACVHNLQAAIADLRLLAKEDSLVQVDYEQAIESLYGLVEHLLSRARQVEQ